MSCRVTPKMKMFIVMKKFNYKGVTYLPEQKVYVEGYGTKWLTINEEWLPMQQFVRMLKKGVLVDG